jgi:hypothetical protein
MTNATVKRLGLRLLASAIRITVLAYVGLALLL